jgi:hypothetical protein
MELHNRSGNGDGVDFGLSFLDPTAVAERAALSIERS